MSRCLVVPFNALGSAPRHSSKSLSLSASAEYRRRAGRHLLTLPGRWLPGDVSRQTAGCVRTGRAPFPASVALVTRSDIGFHRARLQELAQSPRRERSGAQSRLVPEPSLRPRCNRACPHRVRRRRSPMIFAGNPRRGTSEPPRRRHACLCGSQGERQGRCRASECRSAVACARLGQRFLIPSGSLPFRCFTQSVKYTSNIFLARAVGKWRTFQAISVGKNWTLADTRERSGIEQVNALSRRKHGFDSRRGHHPLQFMAEIRHIAEGLDKTG